jgi:transcriptional regulator with XRE-family HTH domain
MPPSKERPTSGLGAQLREFRDGLGLSLRDVASRAGINHGYLSQLERGEIAEPGPSMLHRVATGYGVDFTIVMEWAGYITPTAEPTSPNKALALSYIGDNPTLEELKAVDAMLKAIRSRGATFMSRPAVLDAPLGFEERQLIRSQALALLQRADVLGTIPTPLEQLMEVAGLVAAGEIALTDEEKRDLRKVFGSLVDLVVGKVRGAIHMRAREVWVQPDLPHAKKRFVTAHELGHDILPSAHQLANLDDERSLSPKALLLSEREANQAAIEILAQGDGLRKVADDSALSTTLLSQLSASFQISLQATARYVVEETHREAAATIRFRSASTGNVGPAHLYSSRTFDTRFAWPGFPPTAATAAASQSLKSGTPITCSTVDLAREVVSLRVETIDAQYSLITLFTPIRTKPRLLSILGMR